MSLPDTISWIIESTRKPIIAPGQFHGDLDAKRAGAAHVVRVDDEYRMYYWGTGADDYNRILLATSPVEQPNDWTPQGVILERQPDAPYNFQGLSFPHAVRVDEQKWLLYFAEWGQPRPDGKLANTTGVAVSEDGGSHFSYVSDHPVLALDTDYDREGTGSIYIIRKDGLFRMYYTSIGRYFAKPENVETGHGDTIPYISIGYAVSEDGLQWTKPLPHSLIHPRGFATEAYEYIASKPCILHDGYLYRMWLNTFGTAYRMRGLISRDGLHWHWQESGIDGEMGVGAAGCFDDRQRCYVSVVKHGDDYRCWYTGNGFGTTGMGYAVGRRVNSSEPPV